MKKQLILTGLVVVAIAGSWALLLGYGLFTVLCVAVCTTSV